MVKGGISSKGGPDWDIFLNGFLDFSGSLADAKNPTLPSMSASKKRKTADNGDDMETQEHEYAPYFYHPGAILSHDQILDAIKAGYAPFLMGINGTL
jgi:hypothetical protein